MRRGQEYATGTIIYLLTIFAILVVATYGIHSRVYIQSQADTYKLTALNEQEIAQNIIDLVSSERRYALERSLFLVGAFGGYYAPLDLQQIPVCPDGYEILDTLNCVNEVESSDVITATTFVFRNEEIEECGVILEKYSEYENVDEISSVISRIIPEREYGVPYYKTVAGTCPAGTRDDARLRENVEFMSRSFSEMDPDVYNYIQEKYGKFVDIDTHYILKIHEIDENSISYTWYPVNNNKIKIFDGYTEYNSSVVYEREFSIPGRMNTTFFKLYEHALQEVQALSTECVDDNNDGVDDCPETTDNYLRRILDERIFRQTYNLKFGYTTCEPCNIYFEETINEFDDEGVPIMETERIGPTCPSECEYTNIEDFGYYTNVDDINRTMYKNYLQCYENENLKECIRRMLIEEIQEETQLDTSITDYTRKLILSYIDLVPFDVGIETREKNYYFLKEFNDFSVSAVVAPSVNVFDDYTGEYCDLLGWPSVLDDFTTATNYAYEQYINVDNRLAYSKNNVRLTVTNNEPIDNTGTDGNVADNITKVTIQIMGWNEATGDFEDITAPTEFDYSVNKLKPGQSRDFVIDNYYLNERTTKVCYNPWPIYDPSDPTSWRFLQ